MLRGTWFAASFLDRVDRVAGQALKALGQAAWPANFHPVDFGCGAKPEMQPHITLRRVTTTAANFVDQRACTNFHRDPCPDSISIRFRADGANADPVVRGVKLVH